MFAQRKDTKRIENETSNDRERGGKDKERDVSEQRSKVCGICIGVM